MADVLAIWDDYRLQTWAQTAQACRNSGMTNRAFCRQHGIHEAYLKMYLCLCHRRVIRIGIGRLFCLADGVRLLNFFYDLRQYVFCRFSRLPVRLPVPKKKGQRGQYQRCPQNHTDGSCLISHRFLSSGQSVAPIRRRTGTGPGLPAAAQAS